MALSEIAAASMTTTGTPVSANSWEQLLLGGSQYWVGGGGTQNSIFHLTQRNFCCCYYEQQNRIELSTLKMELAQIEWID